MIIIVQSKFVLHYKVIIGWFLQILTQSSVCHIRSNDKWILHLMFQCVMMLEDVTRMVSALDLFSRNESIEEVSTQSVKFFLLPFLLGNLNAKLSNDLEQVWSLSTCQNIPTGPYLYCFPLSSAPPGPQSLTYHGTPKCKRNRARVKIPDLDLTSGF